MKSLLKMLLLLVFVSGCVTTRSQMAGSGAQDNGSASDHSQPVVTSAPMDRTPQRNSSYGLEEIKSNLAQLTGRFEDLEMRINRSGEKTFEKSENYQSILSRLDAIEKKLAEPPPTPTRPPAPEPKELLKNAKKAFDEGEFESALSL